MVNASRSDFGPVAYTHVCLNFQRAESRVVQPPPADLICGRRLCVVFGSELARQARPSFSGSRANVNASATPTQVGRQPPAGCLPPGCTCLQPTAAPTNTGHIIQVSGHRPCASSSSVSLLCSATLPTCLPAFLPLFPWITYLGSPLSLSLFLTASLIS